MRDLWAFATHLYAQAGIEEACLAWQESGGDVCLLLCCAYLEQRQVALQPERLALLQQHAAAWQSQWQAPLRSLRVQSKTWAAQTAEQNGLREQLKALELASERLLLEQLAALTSDWPPTTAPAPWLSALGASSALVALLREKL
ncbi:TIGR02444 family protein [Atopomonas hussainii]|uniref:TIGR02444 family protein n=1 Tax=Atopomonas hussainii TaxID=1429083 RepID=A0A1H7N5Y4_9GAMM|nr:TIGR02444 family protein [Atopomonas hussainii]SEL18719.1 TIGR02444 family protein [Atopomonas hussainii]